MLNNAAEKAGLDKQLLELVNDQLGLIAAVRATRSGPRRAAL